MHQNFSKKKLFLPCRYLAKNYYFSFSLIHAVKNQTLTVKNFDFLF